MSFFENHTAFLETGNHPARLDARYEILIERHRSDINGKVVLDIGAHDGRWSYAAMEAGCKHVIAVEGRENLVKKTQANFQKYGVKEGRYSLRMGDGLAAMKSLSQHVDTVFLFGIYYHIHNHIDWVSEIRRIGAKTVIIDTGITPCEGEFDNVVRYKIEDTSSIMASQFETFPGFGYAISGHPSRAFVKTSFRVFGYDVEEIDWADTIERYGYGPILKDYAQDQRGTFVARRKI